MHLFCQYLLKTYCGKGPGISLKQDEPSPGLKDQQGSQIVNKNKTITPLLNALLCGLGYLLLGYALLGAPAPAGHGVFRTFRAELAHVELRAEGWLNFGF